MASRNRNFRRRNEEDHKVDEQDNPAVAISNIVAERKKKEKNKGTGNKASLLSFEEDEGLSPVKATSKPKGKGEAKLRPSLRGLKVVDDLLPSSTQQSGAGEYSAERLRELKANTKSFTGPTAPMSSVHTKVVDQHSEGFKLSGSFKPATSKETIPIKEVRTEHTEAELPPPSKPKPKTLDVAEDVRSGAELQDAEEDEFHVPSAELIRLAKEKRERLRSAHLAPDYVPLGGAAGLASLEARLKPQAGLESQLGLSQKEPQQGGSESDEDDRDHRMAFVSDQRNGRGKAHEGHPEEVDDDEDWVRQQIRKGVGAAPAGPSANGQSRDLPLGNGPPGGGVAGSQATTQALISNGESALHTLHKSLERLKMRQANLEKQAARTQENMQSSFESVEQLEVDLESAGSKYTYLQQLKAYIADLCDMLQAKAAIVEELEEHLLAAGEHRAAALAQRSAADEIAEHEPASAAVSAALDVLSRGGEGAAARAAAASAASQSVERMSASSGPVQLDEFGRDISMEANQEHSQRIARWQKRDERWKDDPDKLGGADTTDESDSEERQFLRQRKEVLETSVSVFADADADFSSLHAIKEKLEAWKREQPQAYSSAYAPESLPALFAPFIRNELLAWDPVFQDASDFDQQAWYNSLLEYSSNGAQAAGKADEDDSLVPRLVGSLVYPSAKHAVVFCWNPFSRRQTKRITRLMEHLLVFLPLEAETMQELFAEAQQRLEAAVKEIKLPPWPSAATAVAPQARSYLAHRFGKAVRLMENIAAFDSLLPRMPLISMVFERLVSQQLLSYLTSASGDPEVVLKRCTRIVACLPQAWMPISKFPAARPFTELILRVGRRFEGGKNGQQNSVLAKQFTKLLTRVGEKIAGQNVGKSGI